MENNSNIAKKTIEFSFYLFALTFLLSITLSEGAFLLIFSVLIYLSFKNGYAKRFADNIAGTRLLLPFLLFLILYIFSSYFGLDRKNSFSYFDSEILKIICFLALTASIGFIERKKAEISYAAGAAATAMLGIWQFIDKNIFNYSGEIYRAHGKMHSVSYSETMAIAFLFTFIKFLYSSGKARKIWAMLSALIFCGFAFGLSRGPMLGLFVSLAILWWLEKKARNPIAIIFTSVFAILLGLGTLNSGFRNKLLSIPKGAYILISGKTQKKTLDRTSSGRIDMWKVGVKIIKDYPLTGTGPYNVSKIFHYYHPAPVDNRYNWSDVHNLYIQKTAEYGIMGGIIFFFLLASFFAFSVRNYLKAKNGITLWALAALSGFYIMMITDSSFHLPRVAFNIYFMLVMSYSAAMETETRTEPKSV